MALRAIIIGSNSATRLSLIRCVGAIEGCRVTIINMVFSLSGKLRRPLDAYSKYVDTVLYAKKFDADGLASLLLQKCRIEGEKPIILSVDDDSASLIDTIQDCLKDDFYFSHINHQPGAIAALMDKTVQKALARQHGFNVAESWTVDLNGESYVIPSGITYPCYVKGRLSYHSAKQYQKRCDSRKELEEWLMLVADNNPSPLIVEQFLDITKEYGVIGYANSEAVFMPGLVDLVDGGHGPHKGVSAFGVVDDFGSHMALKLQLERFVKALGLTGLFNVDIVEAGGQFYFVEINFRFAAYGNAVCQAGVNLPAMLLSHFWNLSDTEFDKGLNSPFSYVNEKVTVDDVIGMYRTWKSYNGLIKKADCRFVYDSNDIVPYRVFRRDAIIRFFKSKIKVFLGR